ncbi:MAG: type II secretion system protein [Magnetococcales bacterium]|nr:type II secretion system protein [Magnetococcales bacterium]
MAIRHRGNNASSGFTLIEIVITIVVGGIVVAGLASVLNQMMANAVVPRSITQAAFLAQERMEEVYFTKRSAGFDSLVSASFGDETPIDADFSSYNRYVIIEDDEATACSAYDPGDCKLITVTVNDAGDDSVIVSINYTFARN